MSGELRRSIGPQAATGRWLACRLALRQRAALCARQVVRWYGTARAQGLVKWNNMSAPIAYDSLLAECYPVLLLVVSDQDNTQQLRQRLLGVWVPAEA
jgi:hypothetical protein